MSETSPTYEQLLENNRRWVCEKLALDPEHFERLARGQSPAHLFIGCSDSRVNANELVGTHAGQLFIHRNIANLVVHTDMNLMSVLQFAVEVLEVEHVIVCSEHIAKDISSRNTCDFIRNRGKHLFELTVSH